LHASEKVPLLSGLSLGANRGQLLTQSTTTVPIKRNCQTKEQMHVYQEEQDRLKRLKAAQKEAAKAKSSSASSSQGHGRSRGRLRNTQSQSTTSSQSELLSSTLSLVPNSNPAFILEDYQNI
jgi:hypothetical protein